jgi:hypothetical protein
MPAHPGDEKIVERYIDYLGSRRFNPVLVKVAGRPWGHIIMALITAMTTVGIPIALYHGVKITTHRKRRRKAMVAAARVAKPIQTHPLMVNNKLTSTPGVVAPGMVIGSFRPRLAQDDEYWLDLAMKLSFLDADSLESPEEKEAARWLADEAYVESRRIRLPPGLTGGQEVYAFHLLIVGDHLRDGLIDGEPIPCVAAPGPVGAIQHIPWWVARGEPAPA